MLEIKGLCKTYPSPEGIHEGARPGEMVHALRNVSLEVTEGEFVSVVGLSGTGKTTLLKVIAGLLTPDSGSLEFRFSGNKKKPRIGFMFQSPPLLPWKTALENVLLTGNRGAAQIARARECLKLVGLEKQAEFLPRQLSGGMQTRVALAQTLLPDPELLLLDEPFAFLDEINRERMTEELLSITQKLGTTVILVTHSISEAVFTGDRIIIFSRSREQDTVRSVLASDFERPRKPELRSDPRFVQMTDTLRQLLRGSVS